MRPGPPFSSSDERHFRNPFGRCGLARMGGRIRSAPGGVTPPSIPPRSFSGSYLDDNPYRARPFYLPLFSRVGRALGHAPAFGRTIRGGLRRPQPGLLRRTPSPRLLSRGAGIAPVLCSKTRNVPRRPVTLIPVRRSVPFLWPRPRGVGGTPRSFLRCFARLRPHGYVGRHLFDGPAASAGGSWALRPRLATGSPSSSTRTSCARLPYVEKIPSEEAPTTPHLHVGSVEGLLLARP